MFKKFKKANKQAAATPQPPSGITSGVAMQSQANQTTPAGAMQQINQVYNHVAAHQQVLAQQMYNNQVISAGQANQLMGLSGWGIVVPKREWKWMLDGSAAYYVRGGFASGQATVFDFRNMRMCYVDLHPDQNSYSYSEDFSTANARWLPVERRADGSWYRFYELSPGKWVSTTSSEVMGTKDFYRVEESPEEPFQAYLCRLVTE